MREEEFLEELKQEKVKIEQKLALKVKVVASNQTALAKSDF